MLANTNNSSGIGTKTVKTVNVMYPTHGKLNVLRKVVGTILDEGTGPNGPYMTVQQDDGKIRRLSLKKVVVL